LGLSISVAFSEVAIARFHLDAVLGLGPFGVFIAYGCVGAATAALNYVLLKYWTFYMRKG
ncbi:MAG: hypothetical protein LBR29_11710, partial [Methylobacteriaceae bacterium]|nr:hypothetical protein [Methylobacteriaceae bacterium]